MSQQEDLKMDELAFIKGDTNTPSVRNNILERKKTTPINGSA